MQFPRLIFQTWKTHDVPDRWLEWHRSWRVHNPDYVFAFQDDRENRKMVEDHFPQYIALYDSFPAEIYRADMIRYLFLYLYGGIYADLDFECLKSFDPLLEQHRDKDIILGKMEGYRLYSIPNAIMISKPANPFWLKVVDRISKVRVYYGSRCPDRITGPVPLEKTYQQNGDSSIVVLESEMFYGISCFELKRNPEFVSRIRRAEAINRGAYAITYWSNSWGGTWKT